jgi:serine/threonine protein kinase
MGSVKNATVFGGICMDAFSWIVDNLTLWQPEVGHFLEAEETKLDTIAAQGQWKDVMGGRYRMDMSDDGKLGEGSFCIVRKGLDTETGEAVAIKVYKSSKSTSRSRDALLKKFKRSVDVLRKLQVPFERPADTKLWTSQLECVKPAKLFMRLIDYSKDSDGEPSEDSTDSCLYLITELAQQSLRDFLAYKRKGDARPSKETVRNIAKSIVLVMASLHAKGFVHLDVKPENLMVFDGCLKLIDVDGCVEIGSRIRLFDSSISFSPVYCAPEWAGFLLEDSDACIIASPGLDVWSVGCTICELVTLGDALLKPDYVKFIRKDRHAGRLRFMEYVKTLETVPLPRSIQNFDPELAEFVAGWLLVGDKTARHSCAETLNAPYLATDKLQWTKSGPIKVRADEDV